MSIVGLDDVKLAQAWLQDLARLGYHFPPLSEGGGADANVMVEEALKK